MIGVGLVGFGFAGRVFHAPVIRAVEGLKLMAILQRSGSEAARLYPEAVIVRTMEQLLAIPEVGLVVIATPNTTHFELARECVFAGRDVVIDKPFATNYEEGRALLNLAKEKQRRLTIYQNRRWDGDYLTVRKLIESGELGQIVLFESHFDRYRPQLRPSAWRERDEPGSGMLFDLGVHLMDQAFQLFGVPESISADIRCERGGAVVDDAFDVTLRYPQMRAVLRATMLACTPGPRFQIHGTLGSYVKHGLDPQEEALKNGEAPRGNSWGAEPQEQWGTLSRSEGESSTARVICTERGDYRCFYQNVRDTILGRAQLAVTPEQALEVLWALELARESSARGSMVRWRKPG